MPLSCAPSPTVPDTTDATPWILRRPGPSVGHRGFRSTRGWPRRWPGTGTTGSGGSRSRTGAIAPTTRRSTPSAWPRAGRDGRDVDPGTALRHPTEHAILRVETADRGRANRGPPTVLG